MQPSQSTWECYVKVECHPKHGDDENPDHFATKPVAATREEAASSALREFADDLSPISGPAHDEQRFLFALDRRRAAILREYDHAPATKAILLGEMDKLAQAFGVEWYGVRS